MSKRHKLAHRRVCLDCHTIEPNPRGVCAPIRGNTLTVELSDDELDNLVSFARAQGKTVRQCVVSWIRSSQIKPFTWKPFLNSTPYYYVHDTSITWEKPDNLRLALRKSRTDGYLK